MQALNNTNEGAVLQVARGGDIELAVYRPCIVTRDVLLDVAAGRRADALGGHTTAPAGIVDCRKAIFALRPQDFTDLYIGRNALPREALCEAAAFVVAPAAVELFKAHTWELACAGITRKVFTSPELAQAWVQAWLSRQRQTAPQWPEGEPGQPRW